MQSRSSGQLLDLFPAAKSVRDDLCLGARRANGTEDAFLGDGAGQSIFSRFKAERSRHAAASLFDNVELQRQGRQHFTRLILVQNGVMVAMKLNQHAFGQVGADLGREVFAGEEFAQERSLPRKRLRPRIAGKQAHQFVAERRDTGRLQPDQRRACRDIVLQNIDKTNDLFLRTLLWGSLWESVRNSELPPKGYLAETVRLLPAETDEMLVRSLLSHSARALHRYLSTSTRREFVPQFERIATDRMLHSASLDLRIAWFHSLVAIAETPQGLTALKQLLLGQLTLAGVELRPLDRWNIVTTVIAHADPDAEAIFVAEKQRDPAGDGPKYAYAAEAAKPDAATKQRYFGDFLHNQSRPEDWIEQSLYPFNYWSQSQLTALYLTPALQALPQIKRERKIFFLLDWLDAFIDGQDSAEAQATVYAYLRSETVDRDLRLKILQAVDELDRSVAIRNRFPN